MTFGIFPMRLAVPRDLSFVRFKPASNQAIAKPTHVIGPGVKEIRVHVLGEWRVIYIAKPRDAVDVLHVFQKKTRKTNRHESTLFRSRFCPLLARTPA
jgi:phage-related protein